MMANDREINFYAPCGSMWHMDCGVNCYRDRYNVWIVLTEHGKRYFKHIFVTGREREDGSGIKRLVEEMRQCLDEGPERMTLVQDGDRLPYPEAA